jgi:hypothetical protein
MRQRFGERGLLVELIEVKHFRYVPKARVTAMSIDVECVQVGQGLGFRVTAMSIDFARVVYCRT